MAKPYNLKENIIDGTVDRLGKARETALLLSDTKGIDVNSLFDSNNLFLIEQGITNLNEYSDKCWLLSSIMLYSLVYDKELYKQSGLTWQQYVAESKARIGLSKDEMSRSLTSARFFINHRHDLLQAGWTPRGSSAKLAYAEYALELSGSLKETINHLVNDTYREFKEWFKSYKSLPFPEQEDKRPDIEITRDNIKVNGKEAITISEDLPAEDREKLQMCLEQIFSAIKHGDFPAIVPVYDEKEARNLVNLRDKYRQKK